MSDPFFLQLPSVEKWSNASVLFQPTGYNTDQGMPLMFFVRIYTTLNGLGQIQMDNTNISALTYRRISQTDFYYYENEITNDTHRISTLNPNVIYSVSYSQFE